MYFELRTDFPIASILTELNQVGGTSINVMSDEACSGLLAEAQKYEYKQREKVVGPNKVRQDLSGVDDLPSDSPFWTLRDTWQNILGNKLRDHESGEDVFETPLQFNELSLQRYEIGSEGITPHLDSKNSINLICVFTLIGRCRFCICRNRQGDNPIELNANPGNVILMRAPGFRRSQVRPFHFLSDIQGPRISFGLRQVVQIKK